eukprot:TRINITY_DN12143_c1_g1_i1.p1 TRINITY_DN12143_c1_g1~~TRINITY_DN12143_c1_g1_i1.p1  ORF type:complete len:984 (+),score=309.05 TRINITY_DN12143_c1_g1_i1:265-2952(+)
MFLKKKKLAESAKDQTATKPGLKPTLQGAMFKKPTTARKVSGFGGQDDDDDDRQTSSLAAKLKAMKAKEDASKAAHKDDDDDDDGDVDPLDAFMQGVTAEVKQIVKADAAKAQKQRAGLVGKSKQPERMSGQDDGFDYPSTDEDETLEEEKERLRHWTGASVRQQKELTVPDHTKIQYEDFRKAFYHPVPEIARMTDEEVVQLKAELENVKTRGKDVPRPIKSWGQTGVSSKTLAVLKKLNYETPTPIQAQAIPVIMSGRDMLGIAKTGCGKTLAFLLPLLRHVLDQRRCEQGEGCIGLIMSPTRELALQIYNEARRFCKHLGLRVVCLYGGSDISDQIALLKSAAEIIVCTPGRMIDMLTVNSGRITNLRRCTYVALDEADRMFDMGFEPQVMRILDNIRPSRQTVMFSATFPRAMEALARKILKKPIEVTVGGRSVVSNTVTQHVVVIKEAEKFQKLLELLGHFYNKGCVIIFVQKQEKADSVLENLIKSGYPCLALHGAVSQEDRASNLRDFRAGNVKIMVATSIAARGLDVRSLVLVVNYDCPNHYEDYVHRCGRTGRAGREGTAYTFFTPDDKKYGGNIIRALHASKVDVPEDLQNIWNQYKLEQKKAGKKIGSNSGFAGRGYKFSAADLIKQKQKKLLALKMHGALDDDEEFAQREQELAQTIEDQVDLLMGRMPGSQRDDKNDMDDKDDDLTKGDRPSVVDDADDEGKTATGAPAAKRVKQEPTEEGAASAAEAKPKTAAEIAAARAAAINKARGFEAAKKPASAQGGPHTVNQEGFAQEEIEINEWPQEARYKVTRRDFMQEIGETCGAAITVRGYYYPPGKKVPDGSRKIYINVEGPGQENVSKATAEIRRILKEELRNETTTFPATQNRLQGMGRYNVLAITGSK